MDSNALFDMLKTLAREIAAQDMYGALHIFVCDGNCDDDDLEFCLKDERITPAERDFVNRMLEHGEDRRLAAWLFSECPDLQESGSKNNA